MCFDNIKICRKILETNLNDITAFKPDRVSKTKEELIDLL